jgi:tRNA(His) 5'-end guanylyltransferase
MSDELGDRMKLFESVESDRRIMPLLPIVARLDGKCFSRFTLGMARPFDGRMISVMQLVTDYLVKETNARVGYTQSDEISLLFYSEDMKSQIFFDGRVCKLNSVLAAMASVQFNRLVPRYFPDKKDQRPVFDCRVWALPNKVEAANAFLWRELDASKNSISMAARTIMSAKQMHGLTCSQMQEALFQKGINWNDYPAAFKRGTFVQKTTVKRKFTPEELVNLPPKHAARSNPDLVVERSQVRGLDMPPFGKVLNRVEVLFDGADPLTADSRSGL